MVVLGDVDVETGAKKAWEGSGKHGGNVMVMAGDESELMEVTTTIGLAWWIEYLAGFERSRKVMKIDRAKRAERKRNWSLY